MTVVESPRFMRDAASRLTEQERLELISFLARNPLAGSLMANTGGIRKVRWGTQGRGKRGGVRVIYYYHSESLPLFLLAVFAKNERSNLSAAEQNQLKTLIPRLVAGYKKRGGDES